MKKIERNDWQKFCSKRMDRVSVFDEIECSKMLRDMVNRYFSIGKKDIYGITKDSEKHDCLQNELNSDDEAANTDKYIRGWNIGYYMKQVNWGSDKK